MGCTVLSAVLCAAARESILHFSDEYSTHGTRWPLDCGTRSRHHGGMENRRRTRFYDPRLVRVVQQTRDITIATRAGVPRSTAAGWLEQAPRQGGPRADARHIDANRDLPVLRLRRAA